MPSDDSWTRHAMADLARLREPGRDRPGSVRLGQAERYVNRLAAPDGDLEPKWRDYLRRLVNAFRSRPAFVGDEAAAEAAPASTPSWTDRAREFAPHMLAQARQLDELNAALVANPRNDAFRRLFYGGRLEQTKRFHEEATKALKKAVEAGEQQVAQHAFQQRIRAVPSPAQAPRPDLVARAASADAERRHAGHPDGQQLPARPYLARSASLPAPKKPVRN
ncbi:hypothetical protein [Actinoplanes sp. NPDC049681]|uniref:hypothetical protein n=1 Tax=Actinoplanes sp. NPDC049681 TaxID=3363905 RepID=UPI00379ACA9C